MAAEGSGVGTHPDPSLVEVFRSMRNDARTDPKPAELARVFTICLAFDGGAALPVVGQCVVLPLGQIRARITGAMIAANGVGSATIDVRHGTSGDLPTTAPLYGASAANIPTLAAAATQDLDITNWTLNLQPGDILVATLVTVASVAVLPAPGALTSITLSLFCRHLKWAAGTTGLTDTGGDVLTTAGGNSITLRA